MAESLPTVLVDELTCPICAEIYTDPVQLSCQHSFCRNCLWVYVNSQELDDASSPNESQMEDGDVRCPVCRTTVDLDEEDVTKLPVHFTIANIVEKYQTEVRRRGVRPTSVRKYTDGSKCSMCEGDQTKTAAKGCVKCACLYCQECVDVFHPMRGPLAKHALVEAEQYTLIPLCEEHEEPLTVFCCDCKQLDCFRCSMKNHSGHVVKEANDAFRDEKERMTVKTSQLKKSYQDISSCIDELYDRAEDAKQCFNKDFQTIEAKYLKIRLDLDKWRTESVERVNGRRDSLLKQTEKEVKKLRSQLMEIEIYLMEKAEYFESKQAVSFLLDSEDTIEKLGKRLKRSADMLEECNLFKQSKRSSLGTPVQSVIETVLYFFERKTDGSMKFRFGEQTVLCPRFSMKEGLSDSVAVRNEGRILVNVRRQTNAKTLDGALADQSFQDGRVYWEIDVTYTVKVKQNVHHLVYSAGVLHQSEPISLYVGCDDHSWGVYIAEEIPYNFVCFHSQRRESTNSVYPDGQTEYGSVRQGFYLDFISRTLTILDCTHDRVLHTFRDVDVSEPLTPAVGVHNFRCVDVSARLRTGQDISTLPPCLYKILSN